MEYILTVIILILSAIYLSYIAYEHFSCKKNRKSLKKVIHVNGIRGKSTVVRLIHAGLLGCGINAVGKVTGTAPVLLTKDGEKPIVRHAPSNIREQLRTLAFAKKQGAEMLVVECMAVSPELQFITEHRMLSSDITVVTNVRLDHTDVMGETIESIAYSLSNTVPEKGTLILGEQTEKEVFARVAEKLQTKLIVATKYDDDEMGTFKENIALALAVCEELGLDREKFISGMQKYIPDQGALEIIKRGESTLVSAFAANDPESTLLVYDRVRKEGIADDITVLLCSRADREYRLNQLVEMIEKIKPKKVLLLGSGVSTAKYKLKKSGVNAEALKSLEDLKKEKVVFGCGNVHGEGYKVIAWYKEGKSW